MSVVTCGYSFVYCVHMKKKMETVTLFFQREQAAAPGYLSACESLARGPHGQMARFTNGRSILT